MKSYILTIALFFIPAFCFSQEKLTNYIDSDARVLRTFFTTINSENYLITLDNNDNLTTFTIEEDESLSHVVSQNIYGISKAIKFALSGTKLFIQSSFNVIVADVIDEKKSLNGGTFLSNTEIIDVNNERCMAKGTKLSNAQLVYNFIGPNLFSYDPPSSFEAIKIFGDNVFCRNIISGKSEYYLFNTNNNTLDYLIDASSKRFGAAAYNDLIYFIDIDNEVWYFNPDTRVRENWKIFSLHNKEQNQLTLEGNNLVIYNGTVDSAYVELFNTDTKAKVEEWSFNTKGKVGINSLKMIDDNILLRTSTGQIIILKQGSQEVKKYDGYSKYNFYEWPIAEERYLIFASQQNLMVYDLEKEKIISEVMEGNPNSCYDFSYTQLGDKILFSLFCVETEKKNLYYYDTDSEQLGQYTLNHNSNLGFTTFSELYNLKNKIIVSAQNILEYDGAVSQINDFVLKDIGVVKASLDHDKLLYYKEDNGRYFFYSYDGDKVSEEGNSVKQGTEIDNVGLTSNYVYYKDYPNLYLLDKKLQTTKKILSNLPFYPDPITYNDEILLIDNERLKKVDKDGTVSTLLISKNVDQISRTFIVHDGRLYFLDGTFVYSYFEGKLTELYGNEFYLYVELFTDKNNNLLLRNGGSNNLILGDSIIALKKPGDKFITQTVKLSQDFSIFTNVDNTLYILDTPNRTFYEVAKEINARNIVDMYKRSGDTIAVINRDKFLYTYRCFDKFKNFDIIDQLYIGKDDLVASAYENMGKAILISNNEIFVIDENVKLSRLTSVKGIFGGLNSVIVNDGYFYFLGFSTTDGNQLYRLDARLINKVEEGIESMVTLFPNPLINSFQLNGEGIRNITIIDVQGRIMKRLNKIDPGQSINIEDLPMGNYIALINTDRKKAVPIHFIKSL